MATEVLVPALGESITEGTLAQWLKKPGEAVAQDEPIASLETDKVSVEVPSPVAGVLAETVVSEGDTVAVGALIARIDENGAAAAPAPAQQAADATTNPAGAGENPQVRGSDHAPEPGPGDETSSGDQPPGDDHIMTMSPAVRRAVLEHHLDPTRIKGTGRDGRLTKDDVLAAAQAQQRGSPAQAGAQAPQAKAPTAPVEAAAAAPGRRPAPGNAERREERVKMSRLRQTIAKRLKEAQNTAALLTTFNDVDMSAVMGLRERHKQAFKERHGVGLGITSFFVKASIGALREFPRINAEIQGDEMVLKRYYDIGVAVGATEGLVVPVLRDADRMSFADVEKQIRDFARRAEDGSLSLADLKGGTFTITNGGVFGSLLSTPILNPPQVGILGLHKIQERPVAADHQVALRPMMYVALTYDHRIVDGAEAVRFLVRVKELVEDPGALLLD